MSTDHECPRGEDLVDLLGPDPGPQGARLARHAAACPACAQELGLLREGFAAVAPVPEPEALARIQAAVMAAVAADMAAVAADGHAPAPSWPAPPSAPRAGALRLAAAGVAGMALAAGAGALVWPGTGHALVGPWAGAVGLALVPLLALGLRLASRTQLLVLAAGLLAVVAVNLAGVTSLDLSHAGGTSCLFLALLGSLGPALVLLPAAGAARRGLTGGALFGAAAWCGGVALDGALCPNHVLAHVLVMHLLPLFLAVALFAWLGARSVHPAVRQARVIPP